jgi:crooked neck
VDHRNITLWLKYTEMEMRNRQVNHARNLWDRAVTILPRANQFWYKYTYMEEMVGNIAGEHYLFLYSIIFFCFYILNPFL